MVYILALSLALVLPVVAQSVPPTAVPGVTAAASCPASFYAAGVSFNPQATPNLAGWYTIALPITKCGKEFEAYSITTNNVTPKGSGANLTFTPLAPDEDARIRDWITQGAYAF